MRWDNRSHRRILLPPRSSDISPHRGGVVTGCVPLCPENMCMLHKQSGVWHLSPPPLCVSPLLARFLAPLVQRCRQFIAAVGFEQRADQPELRADLPSSAVAEKMQEDSGILSPLSSPLREKEPLLRPDVWRHNHEYSRAELVSEGKINTREEQSLISRTEVKHLKVVASASTV